MQMKMTFAAGVLLAGLMPFAATAQSGPIGGLYNTGACTGANAGNVNCTTTSGLLNDGQRDLNYSLSAIPTAGTSSSGFAQTGPGFPIGPWLPNDSTSRWLSPAENAAQNYGAGGTFNWSLNFNLSGFDPLTARISGRWAADNGGSILLNGQAIGNGSIGTGPMSAFGDWTNFSITDSSLFRAGANVLTFSVQNLAAAGGNPTGVRVQFLDSQISAVPEPSTYALMLAGIGALVWFSRRRNASGASTGNMMGGPVAA